MTTERIQGPPYDLVADPETGDELEHGQPDFPGQEDAMSREDPVRAALNDVAVWLETEADHPREDPRPAMRLQASLARAALAASPADGAGVDVEPNDADLDDMDARASGNFV